MSKLGKENLKGKILFFSPNEDGVSYFTDSLIYICDHNQLGSLGLIFNRPLDLELDELFNGMKIIGAKKLERKAFLGGPVNPGAIFILHSPDKYWPNTLKVSENVFMSTDYDAIEAIACGKGPKNYILTLGYTGWGPDQLNQEIAENAWVSFDESAELIFEKIPESQINELSKIVGYDIRMISPGFGNA